MGSLNHKMEPVDLSHHLSVRSKSRHPSPLKDIIRVMGYPDMISLAGGLPHPSLFPLMSVNFSCLPPSFNDAVESPLVNLGLTRGSSANGQDLTQFLQYGSGAGNLQLINLVRELTERMHNPPCEYDCLLHPGNTNGWSKVVGLLCEDDDYVIVEEFTYPSAQALWIPLGIKAVPISADSEGMLAEGLRKMLENWDDKAMRKRRPRVLYLVSVGSNPTGITISTQRRKEIYQICVEFDVVIVEDDPYYCLQYSDYSHGAQEQTLQLKSAEDFLGSLTPSFLSMDTQGRVIRLESFSKTLFPGLRLGYFIANPMFIERLLRATEVETQDPAGLSQAFVLSLFQNWGIDGYLTWLQGLQFQYRTRRDWLISAFYDNFEVVPAAKSCKPTATGLVACLQSNGGGKSHPVFSFVLPEAGMFVWTQFYFGDMPRFCELQSQGIEDPEKTFAEELWESMVEELVLLTPGYYYHAWQGPDKVSTAARGATPETAYFRFSFASPTKEQIEDGVKRVRRVVGRMLDEEVQEYQVKIP